MRLWQLALIAWTLVAALCGGVAFVSDRFDRGACVRDGGPPVCPPRH